MELPVATSGVSAGFPSPADDHLDPPSTRPGSRICNPGDIFARVAGDSMQDDGIADGDLLVVDKSLEAYDGCVAVCFLDGEFTLKRLRMGQGKIVLVPGRTSAPQTDRDRPESDFTVWGVVTYAIKRSSGRRTPQPISPAISQRGSGNAQGEGDGRHATRKNDVPTLRLQ